MIIDKLTEFCTDFDLDKEVGDSPLLATNQIDLGDAPTLKNIGDGEVVYANFHVTEAFTDGGDSATLTVLIRSDDTASIHATTSTVHYNSGAMLKAALPLGKMWSVPLPVQATYERYLGVQFQIATAGFDTGWITAYLSLTPVTSNTSLPDAL